MGSSSAQTRSRGLRWTASPRWFLWDGGFLLLGEAEGIVPAHAHHAIQIVLALDGAVAARSVHGVWREGRSLIVLEDTRHLFDGRGAAGAMLFVEPESNEGVWLKAGLADPITLMPDERVDATAAALRALWATPRPEGTNVRDVVRQWVLSLCAGEPPPRRPDVRVSRVLDAIRRSDALRLSLDEAAALAFLSPSRFAHLFKQQVGLPFRRYMLWRKLTRAMLAIGREKTLADAAQAADFADAAHLTRTFDQMFGIPPSLMMRGELCAIQSPFG